jgi:hypothetical protein
MQQQKKKKNSAVLENGFLHYEFQRQEFCRKDIDSTLYILNE